MARTVRPHGNRSLKAELGPYLASGRLQQSPMPAKGGIFDRTWWQPYEPEAMGFAPNKYPPFDYIIASLDGAYTEKEQNDPSAFTVWGIFTLPNQPRSIRTSGVVPGEARQEHRRKMMDEEGISTGVPLLESTRRRIMLIDAWRKHLPFSGPRIEREAGESWLAYKRRTSGTWGLLEHLYDTLRRFGTEGAGVDRLLIEATGPGISAAQELRNRFRLPKGVVQTVPVKGDKVARALSVQPMFASGMIYSPNKDWADLVATEMASFSDGKIRRPHGQHSSGVAVFA